MLKKGSQAAKNYMAKLRAAKGKTKPKKLGALPVGFIGKFWGVSFKIQNQFDIYNNVEAIIEAKETGEIIATITGNEEKSKAFKLYNFIIHTTDINTDDRDKASLKKDIDKFIKNLNEEVKKYNAGSKSTAHVKNITIPAPKKSAAPKVKKSSVIKITSKAPKKIVKSGNSIQYWEIEKQKTGSTHTKVSNIGSIDLNTVGKELQKLQNDILELRYLSKQKNSFAGDEQLKRKFDGETYYCEKITTNYLEAEKTKKAMKYAGFKARIVELRRDRRMAYGVYVR